MQTLEAAEEKLDGEIEKLERLGEDDMERMRRKRMEDLKRSHQQKQAWILQVCVWCKSYGITTYCEYEAAAVSSHS